MQHFYCYEYQKAGRGHCLASSIVYKATVSAQNNTEATYIGLSGTKFKFRYNNHTKSFRLKKYSKDTELSKHIWALKGENQNFTINWEIIKRSNTTMRPSGLCNLCLEEKIEIINASSTLNKKSELISTCRHRRKPQSRENEKPPSRAKKK